MSGVDLGVGYIQLVTSAKGIGNNIKSQLVTPAKVAGTAAGTGAANNFRSSFSRVGASASSIASNAGRAAGSQFVSNLNSRIASAQPAIKRATDVAAGGIIGIGTAAAVMGVKTAAGLEQAQIGFTKMLGSGQKARKFIGQLRDFAKATPFDLPGLVDNARRLVGVGVAAKNVIPTLTAFGDTAGALGLSQDEYNRVLLAYTQMLSKGKVYSEELLQMNEAGIPAQKLLAQSMGVTTDKLASMLQQGDVLAKNVLPKLLTQLHKDYGGSMAQQAQTLTGLWSNFKDTIDLGLSDAIQSSLPSLKAGVQGLTESLSKAIQDSRPAIQQFATSLASPEMREAIQSLIGSFATLFQTGVPILTSIAQAAGPVASAVGFVARTFAALPGPVQSALVYSVLIGRSWNLISTTGSVLAGAVRGVSTGVQFMAAIMGGVGRSSTAAMSAGLTAAFESEARLTAGTTANTAATTADTAARQRLFVVTAEGVATEAALTGAAEANTAATAANAATQTTLATRLGTTVAALGLYAAGLYAAKTGTDAFLEATNQTPAAGDEAINTLTKIGETSRITADDLQQLGVHSGDFKTELDAVFNRSIMDNLNGFMTKVSSLNGLLPWANEAGDGVMMFNRAMESMDNGLSALVGGGKLDQAQRAFQGITAEFERNGRSAQDAMEHLPQLKAALAAQGVDVSNLAGDWQRLTAAQTANKAVSAVQAQTSFAQQRIQIRDAVRAGTFSLKENTQAGLSNRQMVISAVQAAGQLRDQVAQQTGSQDQANAAYDRSVSALVRLVGKTQQGKQLLSELGITAAQVSGKPLKLDLKTQGTEKTVGDLKKVGSAAATAQADAQKGLDGARAAMENVSKQIGDAAAKGMGAAAPAMRQAGADAGRGMADGVRTEIDNQRSSVEAAARAMGEGAAQAAKAGAQVNSPSKITIPAGSGIVEGVEVGIQTRAASAKNTAAKTGRDIATALSTAVKAASDKAFKDSIRDAKESDRISKIKNEAKRREAEAKKAAKDAAKQVRSDASDLLKDLPGMVYDLPGTRESTPGREAQQRGNDLISRVAAIVPKAKSLLTQLTNQNNRMAALADQRAAIATQLDTAQQDLDQKVSDRAQTVTSFKQSAIGDITSRTSVSSIKNYLAKQVQKVQAFKQNLRTLAARGIPQEILDEFKSKGMDGAAAAAALANASDVDFRDILTSANTLVSEANDLGETAGSVFHDAGIQSAQGLVNGLKSQKDAIENEMAGIADSMQSQITTALKIHSPSQVMEGLARNGIGGGLVKGLRGSVADVESAFLDLIPGAGARASWMGSLTSTAGRTLQTRAGHTVHIHNAPPGTTPQQALTALARADATQPWVGV